MSNSCYMGDFDAEKFWRSSNLAKLPSLEDPSSNGIILSMDELLFPFCLEDDLLITRFSFDKTLKDYLEVVGFKFKCNKYDYHTDEEDKHYTI